MVEVCEDGATEEVWKLRLATCKLQLLFDCLATFCPQEEVFAANIRMHLSRQEASSH